MNKYITILLVSITTVLRSQDVTIQIDGIAQEVTDEAVLAIHMQSNVDVHGINFYVREWSEDDSAFVPLSSVEVTAWSWGDIVPADWSVSGNATGTLLGFSFSNTPIPPANDTLVSLTFSNLPPEGTFLTVGLQNQNFSDAAGQALDVQVGESITWEVGIVTSVEEEGDLPLDYSLGTNFPNPFNPSTTITFSIPEVTEISLVVTDILGKEVVTLAEGSYNPGRYAVVWNGRNSNGKRAASGIYLYHLVSPTFSRMNKMMLVQ